MALHRLLMGCVLKKNFGIIDCNIHKSKLLEHTRVFSFCSHVWVSLVLYFLYFILSKYGPVWVNASKYSLPVF